MKACNIFSGGELEGVSLKTADVALNIAADSGWNNAQTLKAKPDILVGDFDSLSFQPKDVEIIRHPIQKDDTDTLLAVKIGLERGCDTFYIYGAMGGRIDHSLANLQTLHFIASHGAMGYILGSHNITVIKNSAIYFSKQAKGTVSVFALANEAKGVNINGLLYPLKDAVISPDFPIGVSNEFIGKESFINVKNGALTIVFQCGIDYITNGRSEL